MKLLFILLCCFASLIANDAIKGNETTNDKTFFDNNLNTEDCNANTKCKESLKNQDFIKELYRISNKIRGDNSSCNGISYLSKLQEFDKLLLQIFKNPLAYQKGLNTTKNLEKKYNILKSYFRYWAYQSIGNFRLYKAFWQEYKQAKKPLEKYFEKKFNFDENKSIYYTKNALNEFLNWAVGQTKIYKDITPLAKIVANQNHSLSYIQDFIFANNPTQDELTIALQAALLNQRSQDILELLIHFGAKIDEGYKSAIFYALENYENTNFLIQKGADVNQVNAFGKSPLFYAIEFNHTDIIQLLLQNGANVNQRYINNNEKLALSANIGSNTPYFITFCALDHSSKSVLMHAATYGDVSILKLLLSKGADLNATDDLGFNALDFALAANKKENANYLKSLGLKANEKLFYGGNLE
ncbi:ankyrin repeat domain-containing protein [Campylobacter sp. VicNov18]|uniref:ankyrin repeat domain-containing protein n=1 Tax=Campylobacter bilis TaxID=2691918 RepID=UPI001E320338|nr:ankyrin repeat domain-containing protein [Campylobacter bilis]MCC8277782.1 ankyrin repeat domain-containing protein [Campylobacter bilis]MCC8299391.1 ankyrin repeat domain-containing protein [Campylobacter bilis]MCC8300691.1 ankyrin repeat domain-containing protein [Campylobacter bilis]MCC8349711.1 ankyrin repeat domain-containing protein [Campylobacter bilis]MCC8355424.1 ankyrin repeat domain-containing protein [Campylobacter bilis]